MNGTKVYYKTVIAGLHEYNEVFDGAEVVEFLTKNAGSEEDVAWESKFGVFLTGDKQQDLHTMYAIKYHKPTIIEFDEGFGVVGYTQLQTNVMTEFELRFDDLNYAYDYPNQNKLS